MKNINKVAFLVLSCDKYADLWYPFVQLFERYWADCPFDRYFATNQIPFDKCGFQQILMGEDKTWSSGLQSALGQLKGYDYVLITLEDLFLIEKVDNDYIAACINEFVKRNGKYLKLNTKTKIHKSLQQYIEPIPYNTPYRHNCVYALWNIETLLSVLVSNENAWQFEKIGGKRTANMDGFYLSNQNAFVFSNVIIKGKWRRGAIKEIKTLLPDLNIKRKIFSIREEIYFNVYMKIFFTFQNFLHIIK